MLYIYQLFKKCNKISFTTPFYLNFTMLTLKKSLITISRIILTFARSLAQQTFHNDQIRRRRKRRRQRRHTAAAAAAAQYHIALPTWPKKSEGERKRRKKESRVAALVNITMHDGDALEVVLRYRKSLSSPGLGNKATAVAEVKYRARDRPGERKRECSDAKNSGFDGMGGGDF